MSPVPTVKALAEPLIRRRERDLSYSADVGHDDRHIRIVAAAFLRAIRRRWVWRWIGGIAHGRIGDSITKMVRGLSFQVFDPGAAYLAVDLTFRRRVATRFAEQSGLREACSCGQLMQRRSGEGVARQAAGTWRGSAMTSVSLDAVLGWPARRARGQSNARPRAANGTRPARGRRHDHLLRSGRQA